MSFMFNPYPYDDPNAINSVPFSKELRAAVKTDSVSSAKRILKDAAGQVQRDGRCIIGLDGYISAPRDQFRGLLSLLAVQLGMEVQSLSTESLYLDSETLHQKLLHYLPEDRETDPPLL